MAAGDGVRGTGRRRTPRRRPGTSRGTRAPHRLRRLGRRTERRPGLAVARAATHLRECRSRRGDDRRGRRARRRDAAAARPGSVGVAARLRNGRRPPVSHPRRGPRGRRRPARVRSAADRGVHPRRRVRTRRCRRRQPDLARRRPGRGGLVLGRQRRGTSSCGTRRPAVDSTVCTPTG